MQSVERLPDIPKDYVLPYYYTIGDILEGNFNCTIYEAFHELREIDVVAKVPKHKNEREAQIHEDLGMAPCHASIAECLDVVFIFSRWVIVVKRYKKDLLQRYKEEPISGAHIQSYMEQLFQGLAFIHEKGLIHRDIKPENLFLDEDNNLKIGDFGLTRSTDVTKHGPMSPSPVTLWYRAMELFCGVTNYTGAIDIWAAGCVMAELYRREPLFNGETDMAMIAQINYVCGTALDPDWDKGYPTHNNFGFARIEQCHIDVAVPLAYSRAQYFINRLLHWTFSLRLTAKEALEDDYFKHPDESSVNLVAVNAPYDLVNRIL